MTITTMHIFGIPLAKVRLPETGALKQQFLPEILQRYEAGAYEKTERWDRNRVHTNYGGDQKDPVIESSGSVPAAYDRLLHQFVKTEFAIQLWHSIFWTGEEYQERHHHLPCHVSFMHFLAFDRAEHRGPVFYDPAHMVKAYCRHDALPPGLWEDKSEIHVSEGDALIFPSYLEHFVPPGKYSKPRVTVSINATLLRKA